jgi:hypothetical protein
MSGNRRRRLEKLEQKLADLARQEALANCNCQERIFVNSTKVLEAEMSKTCRPWISAARTNIRSAGSRHESGTREED